jgi:hypothetical protein
MLNLIQYRNDDTLIWVHFNLSQIQFVANSIYASSLRAERSNPEKQTGKLDCFTLRVRNDEATN